VIDGAHERGCAIAACETIAETCDRWDACIIYNHKRSARVPKRQGQSVLAKGRKRRRINEHEIRFC
jgi:hypothetical protein